jgi:hypothetical protein
MLVSGVVAWLTQGRQTNNGGGSATKWAANAANWRAKVKNPTLPMLARRLQSFKILRGHAYIGRSSR